MSGGQIARINREIREINTQIQEFGLKKVSLLKYFDENGKVRVFVKNVVFA